MAIRGNSSDNRTSPAVEAWIDLAPARSLGGLAGSLSMARGAIAKDRALSGSPGHRQEDLLPVLVPAGLFTGCRWDGLESSSRAVSKSAVWPSLTGLLPGASGSQPSVLEPVHRPLQGLQPGLRSLCLLPNAPVGVTPPQSFSIRCCWQNQSQMGL